MRYRNGHGEATRLRIIEAAAIRFREEGIAASGIASVMSQAGLTHGGFYSHFESKEDLVKSALQFGLATRCDHYVESVANGSSLADIIRSYLSVRHRDNPGRGCAVAALAPEIARHSDDTRAIFTEGLEVFLDMVGRQWKTGSVDARREKATVLYAMMIGTLQLARATDDLELSEHILASGLKAALGYAAAP